MQFTNVSYKIFENLCIICTNTSRENRVFITKTCS